MHFELSSVSLFCFNNRSSIFIVFRHVLSQSYLNIHFTVSIFMFYIWTDDIYCLPFMERYVDNGEYSWYNKVSHR